MTQSLHTTHQDLRVFLIDIVPPSTPRDEIEGRLAELESLVTTYKGIVIVKAIQKKSHPDYRTYVGKGKLEELKLQMQEANANLLIIGNIMKPAQVFHVSEMFREDEIQVWDRVDLILKIFERHAQSTEARLQIELAAIKHMGPRIFGMGMELSRQGGGTGWSGGRAGRGIGETNTERMRRHLKDKKLDLENTLAKYKKNRGLHRENRLRNNMMTVGIVGYTNAGKSCLMQKLTGKNILVEDKLFATLGTAVWEMKPPVWIEENKFSKNKNTQPSKILINDTIWFIRDLPPDLIQAFTSTLEDSIFSQLLLHVIDASDEKMEEKINIVNWILGKIGATQKKLYIFNKIDSLSADELAWILEKYRDYRPLCVSALEWIWIDDLKKEIMNSII
jgi:GTPase